MKGESRQQQRCGAATPTQGDNNNVEVVVLRGCGVARQRHRQLAATTALVYNNDSNDAAAMAMMQQ